MKFLAQETVIEDRFLGYPFRSRILLTDRELECLVFIMLGLSSVEISQQMAISSRTVEHHAERIKDKLGCRKRSEVVAWAMILQSHPNFQSRMKQIMKEYLSVFTIGSELS